VTDLRVVLLVAGALILALIWLLEVRRERMAQRQRTVLRQRTAPVFHDEPAHAPPDESPETPVAGHDPAPLPQAASGPQVETELSAPAPADIISIHVQGAGQSTFACSAVFNAAESAGLEFGDRQIFHMPGVNSSAAPLFSMANMLEPGTFSRADTERYTRGLTLFMCLPTEADARMVLDLMLHTAELLATSLGGVVHGMDRRPLNPVRIAALRQKVAGRGT
jgi:cell division protein ZipA